MPALPCFLLVTSVAFTVVALWLIVRAPEGVETEEGFQVVRADREPTKTEVDFQFEPAAHE